METGRTSSARIRHPAGATARRHPAPLTAPPSSALLAAEVARLRASRRRGRWWSSPDQVALEVTGRGPRAEAEPAEPRGRVQPQHLPYRSPGGTDEDAAMRRAAREERASLSSRFLHCRMSQDAPGVDGTHVQQAALKAPFSVVGGTPQPPPAPSHHPAPATTPPPATHRSYTVKQVWTWDPWETNCPVALPAWYKEGVTQASRARVLHSGLLLPPGKP